MIWNKYHLNDLQPNCEHQKDFNCNTKNFDVLAAIETEKCPKHYRYGSKWLIKVITKDEVLKLIEFFNQFNK
jgi:hypothetical protein